MAKERQLCKELQHTVHPLVFLSWADPTQPLIPSTLVSFLQLPHAPFRDDTSSVENPTQSDPVSLPPHADRIAVGPALSPGHSESKDTLVFISLCLQNHSTEQFQLPTHHRSSLEQK